MAKLTKPEIKAHREAEALINCDRALHDDEKVFILNNWNEGAVHINSAAGAFFTPFSLASHLALEVDGGSCQAGPLLDLCAGIGSLAYACQGKFDRVICVELNADYARVGRRILPDAEWIVDSVFSDRVLALTGCSWAISNPPFGNINSADYSGPYTGAKFEYRVMEVASRLAEFGAFILPQMSASFRYSGERQYRDEISDECRKFMDQTGIVMEANCGIDTAIFKGEWRGVSPVCEIVVCEFDERLRACKEADAEQMDLFTLEGAA